MTRDASRELIAARLLILQSKRLRLASVERRHRITGLESLRARAEALRLETNSAHHVYRSSVLRWGSPEDIEYWVIAYSRLIEMGTALALKLSHSALRLPPQERYELAADVEMLESIVEHWTESKRKAMIEAVASL